MDALLTIGETNSLYDVIKNEESQNADAQLILESLRTEIRRELSTLIPKEAEVVTLYFSLGGCYAMTLGERRTIQFN